MASTTPCGTHVYIISAWALALSVLTVSGNAKASEGGTDDERFPRFFVCPYLTFDYDIINLGIVE